MNKRGHKTGIWFSILIALMTILILGVIMVSFVNEQFADQVGGLPGIIGTVYDIIIAIFEPIINGIYKLVAPEGEGPNIKMMAVVIFLLITLVGTYILGPLFKEPFFPFFIANLEISL